MSVAVFSIKCGISKQNSLNIPEKLPNEAGMESILFQVLVPASCLLRLGR